MTNIWLAHLKEVDAVYLGSQAEAGSEASKMVAALQTQMKEAIKSDAKISGLTKEIQIAKGKGVFMQTCFVCHQLNGEGIPGQIPPLAKSDYMMADRYRAVRNILFGQTGEVVVNGKTYNGTMIPLSETFSRTLAKFRDQELIEVKGRIITVLTPAALAAVLRRHLGG